MLSLPIISISLHLVTTIIPLENLLLARQRSVGYLKFKNLESSRINGSNALPLVKIVLQQNCKPLLNILHLPPLSEVQHVGAEEDGQG